MTCSLGLSRFRGPRASCVSRCQRASDSRSRAITFRLGRFGTIPSLENFTGSRAVSSPTPSAASPKGFRKDLDIVGVGYRAEVKGKQIVFALGYSHPVIFDIPTGIDVAIEKQTHITVTGADRQQVGQVAANIRRLRKPDPYKQKGVRYTGEVLKKKAGKTGAKQSYQLSAISCQPCRVDTRADSRG